MMTAALIANKPEFVKLFLENGVRLKEFVTWDTLLYLYENLEPTCLFHYKLQKVLAEEPERPAPRVQLHHVAQVLRELLGDSTQPLYPRPRSSDRPRLLLAVPNIKVSVSAGRVPRAPLCPRTFETWALFSLGKSAWAAVTQTRWLTQQASFSPCPGAWSQGHCVGSGLLVRSLLLACRGPTMFLPCPHTACPQCVWYCCLFSKEHRSCWMSTPLS